MQWNKRMVEKQVQISAKIFCPHFQNVHELESKQFLQMLYTVLIGLIGSSCLVHYVKKSYSASLNCMWGPLFPEPFESTFTLLLHLLLCLSINLCFYCSWLDNACLIQNLIIPLDTFYESQLATNVLSNFIKNISHADLRPLNVRLDFFSWCKNPVKFFSWVEWDQYIFIKNSVYMSTTSIVPGSQLSKHSIKIP